MSHSFGFRSHCLLLLLDVVRSIRPESDSAAAAAKSESFSMLRTCIYTVFVTLLGISSYGFYWVMQKDYQRQQQFKTFMQEATSQSRRSTDPYGAVQSKYIKLRDDLFNEHNHTAFDYANIEAADAVVASEESFSASWQRALPDAAKKLLKAALLRRAIAVIPRYEEVERESRASRILFSQRLISDVHYQAVRGEHEDICNELEDMVSDANCLEENWGKSTGLFLTARTILHHEANKERVEQEKRKSEMEREKDAQRQAKLQTAAEKEEKEKLARQQKKSAEALQKLLAEEEAAEASSEFSRKKKRNNSKEQKRQ